MPGDLTMALADDLVQAVADKIGDKVRPREWAEEVARDAIEGALSRLRAEGYRYLVSARADGPRRRELRTLASAVERGEDGP